MWTNKCDIIVAYQKNNAYRDCLLLRHREKKLLLGQQAIYLFIGFYIDMGNRLKY